MGTDNLFHKRKERKIASFKRTQARRSPHDTVLIVCEGEKTEPNYFKELRADLQLNVANIEITGDTGGSAPISIVSHGIKRHLDYDKVFCVFDKDRHTSYQLAIDKLRSKKFRKGHTVQAITSVPCFEFWLLLHFKKTTRRFDTAPGSICERVISELETHLPQYSKGARGTYRVTKDRLPEAVKRAKEVAAYCAGSGTDHPSTQIYELVEYLQQLKK